MSTNEAQSFKTFKANVAQPRDRIDRIENVLIAGMPDCNATFSGVDVWIEIKTVLKDPVRKDTPLLGSSHQLSQEQANWLMMHARAGGRGFVYIDAETRRYLIAGRDADKVNSSSIVQLMLMAAWTSPVPTATTRWEDLRSVLRGPA